METTKKNICSNAILAVALFTAFQIFGATKDAQNLSISAINDKVTNLTNTVEKLKTDVANLQKKAPEQKKSPQQTPIATQPTSRPTAQKKPVTTQQPASPTKPASKTSSLLSKSVPFTKKSAAMSLFPGIQSAEEFINLMVLHSKKNELENDLFSNNPSNKTIGFLGLELRKAYPLISLDDAVYMIHDAIAEQIFNKRTSSEFMNFVRNAIKNYWNTSKQSPILNLYQGTNLTQEEQENLSSPL